MAYTIPVKGDETPVSNGYLPKPSTNSEVMPAQGDWPSDGFILPGSSTIDQGPGRGQFVQGSNGRGQNNWRGGPKHA